MHSHMVQHWGEENKRKREKHVFLKLQHSDPFTKQLLSLCMTSGLLTVREVGTA